jgi:hypothetical protein
LGGRGTVKEWNWRIGELAIVIMGMRTGDAFVPVLVFGLVPGEAVVASRVPAFVRAADAEARNVFMFPTVGIALGGLYK